MTFVQNRRAFLAAGAAAIAAGAAGQARAQAKPTLRFSAVFSEQDIRAEMMKRFTAAVSPNFTLQSYFGGNLFKQGTELVAMQRGNLEMGNIAPQDVSNQVPAWSIMTAAYLFRDADHMTKVFNSDVGQQMKQMAEDQLGIRILAP
ncbi:MAG: C4-dicarboxylate ABC transporter, partial [Proteobacteria bacterium]|nr:C4-dicarboxylate ABC transporter [Pseudomonadota bacterium]